MLAAKCQNVLTVQAIDRSSQTLVATIVCKLEHTRWRRLRGYIAMIAVQHDQRKQGLGTILAERAIASLKEAGADEIVLETEEINAAALRLYRKLGFLRTKHLKRYYLNGNNAFRLVMYLKDSVHGRDSSDEYEEWADEGESGSESQDWV
jgi:N-alpha-acetyltransferase 30